MEGKTQRGYEYLDPIIVRRILLRAGVSLATDTITQKIQQQWFELVQQLMKDAQISLQHDNRMTFRAKDIVIAAKGIGLKIYGYEDADQMENRDEEKVMVSSDDEEYSDESSSEDSSCDESEDECKHIDGKESAQNTRDSEFGDGEFSDAGTDAEEKFTIYFDNEDKLWFEEDGFLRITEEDVERVVRADMARDSGTPYLIPRSTMLKVWTYLSSLPITRAGLSAMHNVTEQHIYNQLAHGKLGSDIAFSILQDLCLEQACKNEQLEKKISKQAQMLANEKTKLQKMVQRQKKLEKSEQSRTKELHRSTRRVPLAPLNDNIPKPAKVNTGKSTPSRRKKRLSDEMLTPPTSAPQSNKSNTTASLLGPWRNKIAEVNGKRARINPTN